VPIWVTEYGHETKPEEPKGVTYAQQSTYLRQALNYVAGDPAVTMFIWFILRDDPTSAWQSGLVERDGVKKPSFRTFTGLATKYDGRNPQIFVRGGTQNPLVKFAALELWSRSGAGTKVGMTMAVFDNGKEIKSAQPVSILGVDGWVSVRVPIATQKKHEYYITIVASDVNGNRINRSVLLRAL
jgi:hypothetical protein